MSTTGQKWQKLFLFSLGLFVAAAFCMKWMENDFVQGTRKFTIIGLELFYSKEKVSVVLAGLDEHVKTILRYHLSFDFVFMAGAYPGIAALCMIGRKKSVSGILKKILFVLAILQVLAWGCDIFENLCLLKWINNPAIGSDFSFYHLIVAAKWIMALMGALVAIPFALRSRRRM